MDHNERINKEKRDNDTLTVFGTFKNMLTHIYEAPHHVLNDEEKIAKLYKLIDDFAGWKNGKWYTIKVERKI